MAEPILKTCGNCEHRDDDGDCLALAGEYMPMWTGLQMSIAPVDADAPADDCEAWFHV
jgi:hypothetical protein